MNALSLAQPHGTGSSTKVKGLAKPIKKTLLKSSFDVRGGTLSVCRFAVGGDMAAAILFHALIELWLDTKTKVRRGDHDYLFLSGEQLQTLSGLSSAELKDRAVPKLKQCPFFEMKIGRLTRDHANTYQIRFDQDAFWIEVAGILDPTKEISHKEDGHKWVHKEVDPTRLPYVFKRLYHAVCGNG